MPEKQPHLEAIRDFIKEHRGGRDGTDEKERKVGDS